MESSIAVFLMRYLACALVPTISFAISLSVLFERCVHQDAEVILLQCNAVSNHVLKSEFFLSAASLQYLVDIDACTSHRARSRAGHLRPKGKHASKRPCPQILLLRVLLKSQAFILAEGAIALSVTLSGGVLFAS